jgi:hypothetical protein
MGSSIFGRVKKRDKALAEVTFFPISVAWTRERMRDKTEGQKRLLIHRV